MTIPTSQEDGASSHCIPTLRQNSTAQSWRIFGGARISSIRILRSKGQRRQASVTSAGSRFSVRSPISQHTCCHVAFSAVVRFDWLSRDPLHAMPQPPTLHDEVSRFYTLHAMFRDLIDPYKPRLPLRLLSLFPNRLRHVIVVRQP